MTMLAQQNLSLMDKASLQDGNGDLEVVWQLPVSHSVIFRLGHVLCQGEWEGPGEAKAGLFEEDK